jgi:hypothetical protein
MEYILAAKMRCEKLYIGITNPDMLHAKSSVHDINRGTKAGNPLSYRERCEMIRKALAEFRVAESQYEIIPFPISYPEYIDEDNLDLVEGDVVIIVIAGGNTIPTAAKIIKHAHKRGAKTIGTAGIFGFGDENIEIKDISEYDESNPAVEELRAQGITENHLVLTTNKLIRDNEPVTPYTLDEVAKIITMNALKLLRDIND